MLLEPPSREELECMNLFGEWGDESGGAILRRDFYSDETTRAERFAFFGIMKAPLNHTPFSNMAKW